MLTEAQTIQAIDVGVWDLIVVASSSLAAFAGVVWAFAKVLMRQYEERVARIDGPEGHLVKLETEINSLEGEVVDLRRLINKVEKVSVTEQEVRVIMTDSIKPISNSLNQLNDSLGEFMRESRASQALVADQLSQMQASVAVLNDREERRRRGNQE